ncbi:MAG TPA: LOG family protein [Candidatus Polarisedimenticolia bacterium]|nr:LOG family protein [Candidatus Polarisedimenticolia bacterium]
MQRLKNSTAYLRAYEDVTFLNREDLRPVRLQLELLKPELMLQEQGIVSTVVVFGSTRTVEKADILPIVRSLEKRAAREAANKAVADSLAIARRLLAKTKYYDEAREFARLVTSAYQMNGRRDYVIVTGGGPGIMEAANRGADDVGGKSVGLNITLPEEQYPNPYITPELCFQFHYFALRKMHFMMRAKAMVFFPGGYGTMDELFEALTLVQTGKVKSLPVILFGKEFWTRAVNFEFLRDEGVIGPQDVRLFRYAETADEAWDKIQAYYREKGRPYVPSDRPVEKGPIRTKRPRRARAR